MSQITFPPLRLAVLRGLSDLKEELSANPNLFDENNSGYDNETVEMLKKLLEPKTVERIVEKKVTVKPTRAVGRPSKDTVLGEEDEQLVREEIVSTLKDLKKMTTDSEMAPNHQIQITKNRTQLIDQLLKMQERDLNVRKMGEFIQNTVQMLERYVKPEDRQRFMDDISEFR